ncbi:MAG: ankyrin repeat domain-containing protein [Pyrinomonadaceae bacterium]
MSKKSFIDSVKVGSPCGEDWKQMSGNARVRFCSHCSKHVNNLSEMTRKEAARFVRGAGGDICIRYITDPVTRQPMFANQLLQITRRAPGIAAGVMTASMSLSTAAYAQGGMAPVAIDNAVVRVEGKSCDDNSKSKAVSKGQGKITGTVTDPNGAVIPNANVTLFSGVRAMTTSSDADGIYKFENLSPGTYRIEIDSPGFIKSTSELVLNERNDTVADSALEVGGFEEFVEVKADVELQVSGQSVAVGGMIAVVEYTSPLSRAIADDDVELVRELLVKGANLNAKEESYSKITPLFVAVEQGNIEIVRLLLDFGAKVNARDSEKQTPLMRLDDDATPELVELLLQFRAKVDAVDNNGNTPLIIAAGHANPEVIEALIDGGADVNASNKEGKTALMSAADSDNIESVRTLLVAGAKANAKDDEGDDAWEYAYDKKTKKLLVSYGATPRPDTDDEGTPEDTQDEEKPR